MIKYIVLVALGALSYGMLSSFAKIAYTQGYNAGEITFAQALTGALILWAIVLFRNIKKVLSEYPGIGNYSPLVLLWVFPLTRIIFLLSISRHLWL